MTDVKKLLDEATPLPWSVYTNSLGAVYPGIEAPSASKSVVIWGSADEDAGVQHPPDAALIVHAVNHLPDYEDAVDALEKLADVAIWAEPFVMPEIGRQIFAQVNEARAVLRRLRGEG